ncbi:SDR family NAD(P)-dependent oxidoreductase [Streptomyces sioyaensis]|uniref:SDR family NAD(P)-dependent oxidoreductase n=1 Tax=Streptomyces sioyaensis TaxID=67364 RepID=UPI0035AC0996|nr:SDR family NAD(P)-dependent oxidoreductase [Streptomyces sioyaensis]
MLYLIAAAECGDQADSLVNISSDAAHRGFPNFAVQCAIKAAVTHLSHALHTELGRRQICVTHIEPGLVKNDLRGHITPPGVARPPDGVSSEACPYVLRRTSRRPSPSRRANQAM